MIGTTKEHYLIIDHEVGRYYRQLFLRQFGIKLQRPWRGEHITLPIRPPEGSRYVFELDNKLWTNGNAIWLDVICPELEGPFEDSRPIHFCIGYLNNDLAVTNIRTRE